MSKNKTREEIAKATQKLIIESIVEEKNHRLVEKFNRFEIRQNKFVRNIQEYMKIKLSWISTFCGISAAFTIKNLIANRRKLKFRARKNMNWLLGVSRVMGRMKIRLKKVRNTLKINSILHAYNVINT